jgi:NADH-quinone oxidoreductase subunit D
MHKAQAHFGYLHRGFEKLAEHKTYDQFVPITNRLDYLAGFSNSYSYVLAVEKLLGVKVPPRAEYIRVIVAELNRLSSHLMWLGAAAIDLGAITPVMYGFREREQLIDLLEMVCGNRMTFAFNRIGGVKEDLPEGFKEKTRSYLKIFLRKINDYDVLLKKNPIWLHRTREIGVISAEEAINFGLTGPSLRGSGVKFDIRKNEPYSVYDQFDFDVPIGQAGDVYDRYLVRLEEMRQSARIIEQALDKIPEGPIMSDDPRINRPSKKDIFNNVESLIHYCYIAMEGIQVPTGEVYSRIEGPRGEFGFYIISDGSSKPYRLFIRVPTPINFTPLNKLCKGRLIADLPSIIGGFDLVLGEADK